MGDDGNEIVLLPIPLPQRLRQFLDSLPRSNLLRHFEREDHHPLDAIFGVIHRLVNEIEKTFFQGAVAAPVQHRPRLTSDVGFSIEIRTIQELPETLSLRLRRCFAHALPAKFAIPEQLPEQRIGQLDYVVWSAQHADARRRLHEQFVKVGEFAIAMLMHSAGVVIARGGRSRWLAGHSHPRSYLCVCNRRTAP